MVTSTLVNRTSQAFDEIDDEDSPEQEERQLYYLCLSSTFSQTEVVLADYAEKRFRLDERGKRCLKRCKDTVKEIYEGAKFIEDAITKEDYSRMFEVDLKPYRMFLGVFGRKNPPLMCTESVTKTMISCLDSVLKYSKPQPERMEQTFNLLRWMTEYCLARSS
jgi:hypothetical protein